MNLEYRIIPIGDAAVSFVFGDTIDLELNRSILSLYRKVKKREIKDFALLDIVPTYCSLTFHLKPAVYCFKEASEVLKEWIDTCLQTSDKEDDTFNDVIIPVNYNGPDLERVSRLNGLSIAKVIEIHTSISYQVAMIGFRPYFPYLIGLDPRLETARLDSPRKSIPAGSVAIGGGQTGVYPEASPGGWNIIGESNPQLLKQVKPGDQLIFKSEVNGCL